MKVYKRGSAAYKRQKETQKNQREAIRKIESHPESVSAPGRQYLHPERRDAKGKLKAEYRKK